ncbi:MAG: prepilin-type N-terminal cleavage/methylation domain-containing protein [Candidatus Scalindua sp.]|nr:prepilin-type N-terminal cleavage/methylation domain-containing protein [Candidatus Scalindua sp.]
MKKQLPIFNRNSRQLKRLPKAIHRIAHNRKSEIVNLKSQSGFTLIELMVVIGIIIVIAAAVLTVIPGMRQKAQEKATKAFMERLEVALEQYYNDYRSYPPGDITGVKTALDPSDTTSKQYIEFKDSEVNSDNEIVDYWGNPFVYATPGTQNTSTYDLYSEGADGASASSGGDADDINNWSR